MDRNQWAGNGGNRGFLGRDERPELPPFFEIDATDGFDASIAAGIDSTVGDPLFEILDDAIGKLAFGRHLKIGIAIFERLEQCAFAGFAGNDGRTGIAALIPATNARIELEPAAK